MANLVGLITTTKTTLAAATVTKVENANNKRRFLGIYDETGGTLYWAAANSQPANADTMAPIPANGALLFDVLAMPTQDIYLFSTTGGDVKVQVGV